MNTKVKYLLGSIIFVLCVGMGSFITKVFNPDEQKMDEPQEETPKQKKESTESKGSHAPIVNSVVHDTIGSTVLPNREEPVKIVDTNVKKKGKSYSLEVLCDNVPVNVTLVYEMPELNKNNTEGYFTEIPGIKSGCYKINVRNRATNEVLASKVVSGFKLIEEKPVEPMSASEFQTLLLNQNDNSLLGGNNPKVAKSIALSFEGLRDGEKKPGDILSVREKIAYGIWASAKVLRVEYDKGGKINSVRIQPIY